MGSSEKTLLKNVLGELKSFLQGHSATTYLLAVSGGRDSMLLCHLMLQLKIPVEIMHINYGLRSSESDLDQKHVEEFCIENHIKLHLKRISKRQIQKENIGNLQAEARAIRYDFFNEVLNLRPGCLICTAHHKDDQVETFWLQLFRGSGMKGLGAMKKTNNAILRPLLNLSRNEIDLLVSALNIKFREDSSNINIKYRRNLWRHNLLPFLRENIPHIDDQVYYLQGCLNREMDDQEKQLKSLIDQYKIYETFSLYDISQLSAYQYIELFKSKDIPSYIIKRISELFNAPNGKYLVWKRKDRKHKSYLVKIDKQLQLVDDIPTFWRFEIHQIAKPLITNAIDLEKIEGKPYFRKAMAQDKIKVAGLKGSKKVMQILKEQGLPLPIRTNQMLLCDEKKVLAIPPFVINELIKAEPNSKKIGIIQFEKSFTFGYD